MWKRSLLLAALLCGCSDDSATPDAAPDLGPDATPVCTHPQVDKSCLGDWCNVAAGCFQMGSPGDEKCRETCWVQPCPRETLHEVTLTHGFKIKATEVTQGEFEALMGYNPSYYGGGANTPVEMVSWHEAAAYCNALSAKEGFTPCYDCQVLPPDAGVPDSGPLLDASAAAAGQATRCETAAVYPAMGQSILDCPGYRLPTEAEWEYAYRAGTQTAYYNGAITACSGADPGVDKIGWYTGNSGKQTHEVGGKQANAWGLYDMAGNVWEWCHDRYAADLGDKPVTDPVGPDKGDNRADRGGSCWSQPQYLRAALRDLNPAAGRFDYIGFRPVRTFSN